MTLLMGAAAWLSTRNKFGCNRMDLTSVFWVVLVRMAEPSGLRRKATVHLW